MSLFQAIVLGLIQGATEFVPVSSSGHLVLLPWLLGWPNPSLAFDSVLHLGTLFAVLIYLRREIAVVIDGWLQSVQRRSLALPEERLGWLLIVSTIPGVVVGFLIEDYIERLFGTPRAVAVFLLVTGAILVVSERLGRRSRTMGDLTVRDAVWMGLAQALAIAPGISRSGATIASGLTRALGREDAARYSFLMVIPIIAGAAALQIADLINAGLGSAGVLNLGAGFLVAFIAGYAAIGYLLRHLQQRSLRPFAFYCWGFGALSLIVTFIR